MELSEWHARKDQARHLLAPWAKTPKLLNEIVQAKKFPEKPFRFMDLPRELRDMVYELVLPVKETIDLWPRMGTDKESTHEFRRNLKYYKRTITPTLKLLRVNKKINEETSSIFYGKNEFRFTKIEGFIVLQCFLDTIGLANASRLRRVAVHAPFHGKYTEIDYHNTKLEYSYSDNCDDSISSMDFLRIFLRSAHMRTPKIRQTFNMWCAVKKVCSILSRSGAGIQVSIIIPLEFITRHIHDSWNGRSINSRAVKTHPLGFRPTFEEVVTAFGDVKLSLVLLQYPSRYKLYSYYNVYMEAHKEVVQLAQSAHWEICEASQVEWCPRYNIRPSKFPFLKDAVSESGH